MSFSSMSVLLQKKATVVVIAFFFSLFDKKNKMATLNL